MDVAKYGTIVNLTVCFFSDPRHVVHAFGGGKGPILLDEVKCSGNEGRLLDCNHDEIERHHCTHTEDVGISCGKSLVILVFHIHVI